MSGWSGSAGKRPEVPAAEPKDWGPATHIVIRDVVGEIGRADAFGYAGTNHIVCMRQPAGRWWVLVVDACGETRRLRITPADLTLRVNITLSLRWSIDRMADMSSDNFVEGEGRWPGRVAE